MLFARVSVPVEDLVRPPTPVIAPLKVFEPASAIVRVCPEAMLTFPPLEPPPCRDATVSLELTWKSAPAVSASVTVPVLAMATPPLMASVPALIVVVPE